MVITIDVALWGLVIGTVLPILVALITARFAASRFKSIILLFLATVTAIGQEILAVGEFEVKSTIVKLALLFLTSVGLHYGLLKPTGITGSNGAVQVNAPGGLGA